MLGYDILQWGAFYSRECVYRHTFPPILSKGRSSKLSNTPNSSVNLITSHIVDSLMIGTDSSMHHSDFTSSIFDLFLVVEWTQFHQEALPAKGLVEGMTIGVPHTIQCPHFDIGSPQRPLKYPSNFTSSPLCAFFKPLSWSSLFLEQSVALVVALNPNSGGVLIVSKSNLFF